MPFRATRGAHRRAQAPMLHEDFVPSPRSFLRLEVFLNQADSSAAICLGKPVVHWSRRLLELRALLRGQPADLQARLLKDLHVRFFGVLDQRTLEVASLFRGIDYDRSLRGWKLLQERLVGEKDVGEE